MGYELIQFGSSAFDLATATLYDYQSLAAGLLAILAAWIAAKPVWKQLRDTSLQAMIAQRETIVGIKKDAERRFAKVEKVIAEPFRNLSRLTTDPVGEMIEIGPHDAFGVGGQLQGVLDWYLETLRETESPAIEAEKDKLRDALGKLERALNDVHWIDHNDQHGDDYSLTDEEWEEVKRRNVEAPAKVYEHFGTANQAMRDLKEAQSAWLETLRALIAQLDGKIVGATH